MNNGITNNEIEMSAYAVSVEKRNQAAGRIASAVSGYAKKHFSKRLTVKVERNTIRFSMGGKQYQAIVWANNQDSKENAESFKRTVHFDAAMLTRFAPEAEIEGHLVNPRDGRGQCLQGDLKNLLVRGILENGHADLEVRTETRFEPFFTDGSLVVRASGEEFAVTLRRTR